MSNPKLPRVRGWENITSDTVLPVSLDEDKSVFVVKSIHDDKIISLEYCPASLKEIHRCMFQAHPFRVSFAEIYDDWEDYGKKEPNFRVFTTWSPMPTEEEIKAFFDNLPPSGWEGVDLKECFGEDDGQ